MGYYFSCDKEEEKEHSKCLILKKALSNIILKIFDKTFDSLVTFNIMHFYS